MFTLRQASVKMAVLLHKQAKVPFIMIIAVDLLSHRGSPKKQKKKIVST